MKNMLILLLSAGLTGGALAQGKDEECPRSTRGAGPDLVSAVFERRTNAVQKYLDSGIDPNLIPAPKGHLLEGAYPLHIAIYRGNIEIIATLLRNGADIELQANNKDRGYPLHWAVFFMHAEAVSLLLEFGASVNSVDGNGLTPLDVAYFLKDDPEKSKKNLNEVDRIENIVREYGGISSRDKDPLVSKSAQSAGDDLVRAVFDGHIESVQKHLKSGVDPNAFRVPMGKDLAGAYPLHLAILLGNLEIIKILLDNGADMEKQADDENRSQPLHWAIFFMRPKASSLLLDHGASVNSVDGNGSTPLDVVYFLKEHAEKNDDNLRIIALIEGSIIESGGVRGICL